MRFKLRLKIRFLFFFVLLSFQVAANPVLPEQQAEKTLEKVYHSLNEMPTATMTARLETVSKQLLGKPYILGALGEGQHGLYDQRPLYRVDGFDCETYVDTVLAIALAKDIPTFKQCINQIRYRKGQVSFFNRNHFASLDWNQNNQRQGFIQDITKKITNQEQKPVAEMARALINKPSWYQHFGINKIRISTHSDEAREKRLAALKKKGRELETVEAVIPYIPLDVLFNEHGHANQHLFQQIPNGAIIEIIRPNWDLKKQIGTCLNVSHLGFAFWEQGRLLYREASSIHQQTIEVPLIDYLSQARKSPTIKGINIQVVSPDKPLQGNCLPLSKKNQSVTVGTKDS